MKENKANILGYLAITLWAFAPVIVAYSDDVPEFLFTSLTHFICFLTLSVKWISNKTNPIPFFTKYPKVLLLTTLGISGFTISYVFSMRLVESPVETTLIVAIWPTVAVLATCLLPENKTKPEYILGSIIAFIGVTILLAKPEELRFNLSIGQAIAFLGVLIWVLYSVGIRLFKEQPSDIVTIAFLISAIITFLLHVAFEEKQSIGQFGMMIVLAYGISSALAYYFWDITMKFGNTQLLNISSNALPLLSTILLIIFGQADITTAVFLSAFLIVLGALWAAKEDVKKIITKKKDTPPTLL